MYVKSLTLKGFKSFASATTMRLEPGITCIVGPNGSGKSNVVDALAWVMGEQGAKSLRGGKMEDVIFAGTAGRAPLGRAEVAPDHRQHRRRAADRLHRGHHRRTMFRNGGSEYAINGTPCRLLDVQELLSDSGIGREMHVIVGQGQLDTVLRATPEERRGFIEEAAGVLKHRKRKEKALRKLESMEANLTRVNDLTGEIRRQLGPLGRQAEAARRAAVIQADARDARLRLLADDLVQLTSTLEQEVADETALVARRTEVEEAWPTVRSRLATLEQQAEDAAPELTRAQERWFALQQLRDKLDLDRVAGRRAGAPAQPGHPGRADLRARPRGAARPGRRGAPARRRPCSPRCARPRSSSRVPIVRRAAAEQAYAAEQQRLQRLARAAADRREGLAKLAGQVGARRSRIEAGEAEIGRLRGIVEQSLERAARRGEGVRRPRGVGRRRRGGRGGPRLGLREPLPPPSRGSRPRSSGCARPSASPSATAPPPPPGSRRSSSACRRKDGAATLLAAADAQHGIVGSVASLLQVARRPRGCRRRRARVGRRRARRRVGRPRRPRADDPARRGRAAGPRSSSARPPRPVDPATWPASTAAPSGPARSSRPPRPSDRPSSSCSTGWPSSTTPRTPPRSSARGEGITAVTTDGDVFAPGWVRGGSSARPEPDRDPVGRRRDPRPRRRRHPPRRAGPVRARQPPRRRHREADERRRGGARGAARVRRQDGRRRRAARPPRRDASAPPRPRPSAPSAPSPMPTRRWRRTAPSSRRSRSASTRPAPSPTEGEEPGTDERDRLELEASRGRTRGDRAAPDPAHQGGAGPCAARPRRLPRGRSPQRARRPRAAGGPPGAPQARG